MRVVTQARIISVVKISASKKQVTLEFTADRSDKGLRTGSKIGIMYSIPDAKATSAKTRGR